MNDFYNKNLYLTGIKKKSTIYLLISNFVIIFLAIYEKWILMELLWVYIFQFLINVSFFYLTSIKQKEFKSLRFRLNLYLLFFGVYFYFLFFFTFLVKIIEINNKHIIYGIIIYFINYLITYIIEKNYTDYGIKLRNKIYLYGSAVIPTHLILIAGGFLLSIKINFSNNLYVLLLFLILKMIFDIRSNIVQESIGDDFNIEEYDLKQSNEFEKKVDVYLDNKESRKKLKMINTIVKIILLLIFIFIVILNIK